MNGKLGKTILTSVTFRLKVNLLSFKLFFFSPNFAICIKKQIPKKFVDWWWWYGLGISMIDY